MSVWAMEPFGEMGRLAQLFGAGSQGGTYAMPMDVYRDGDTFHVLVDLPGLVADSLEVTTERGTVTIRGQRQAPYSGSNVRAFMTERPYGTFSRRLTVGDSLDVEQLHADYTDGVLQMIIPVSERAKPRQVEVSHTGTSQNIDTQNA